MTAKGIRLVVCLITLCWSIAFGQTANWSAERKALAEQTLVDRLHYATSKDYHPYLRETMDFTNQAWGFLEAGNFEKAIEAADRGLVIDKFNIRLLMAKAAAYRALKDEAQADAVRAKWIAIVDSIIVSGDGTAFASAYTVISVDEEYAVLRIFGEKLEKQSLVLHEGKQYDMMEVENVKTGDRRVLYFNVDLPLASLDR